MQDLLNHYERELAFLRERSKLFAERYPKIAGRLQISGEIAEDPHVERMIQSFALLTSRIHKRLDDDFSLFTESFLEVVYPHYLRPLPSASIAQFELGTAAAQMSAPALVPRGTSLTSRPVRGVSCRFRTAFDVPLLPLVVAQAQYRAAVSAPAGTRLPAGATSVLSITLDLVAPQMTWDALGIERLRVFLDGEPAQVSVLREALASRAVGVMVHTDEAGPWQGPLGAPGASPALPQLAGFGADEALLDADDRSHPAYRLLAEYFAYPDKFNFIDLPWPSGALQGQPRRRVVLHLLFAGVRADSDASRLLESVTASQFKLGCTPVVNLFRHRADPIRITHERTTYPLVVDARRAYGYEVYRVERVYRVQQTAQGESVTEFRPFYSLSHAEVGDGGRYWYLHRDESVAEHSPGYELELGIVDLQFDPRVPQAETLSIEVTASNRDLPALLAIGHPGGDLTIEGGGIARTVRLLRKPTPSARHERGRGLLWRLISHLSLNHLSLSGSAVEALREMLRLYDLAQAPATRRQIDGVRAVEYRPTTGWLPGRPFATFVRGIEVRLTVDEEAFVGSGLAAFVGVLDRFFALYVHVNGFSQLVVVSERTGQEVYRCPPRSGEISLM